MVHSTSAFKLHWECTHFILIIIIAGQCHKNIVLWPTSHVSPEPPVIKKLFPRGILCYLNWETAEETNDLRNIYN